MEINQQYVHSDNLVIGGEEFREGMRILRDVPIVMSDKIVLRADVFLPTTQGKYPAIMSYGPYGKGLMFQEGYTTAWEIMVHRYPDIAEGSTHWHANWEVVDPEKWVKDGYVCIRVDSRGAGRSPGIMDTLSPREDEDFYTCIEWAADQSWSNGKVGLAGISYYARNQWRVAELKPPHLAAICVWEGFGDRYRDSTYHGGIYCTMPANTYTKQMAGVQHGVGERGPISYITGEYVSGPETLSPEELAKNRVDNNSLIKSRPLFDEYYAERSAQWSKIEVPLLSCGNWGGHGLHLRGNVEGYLRAASTQKWLELHGGMHWEMFYTDYGNDLQKRFFDHFLKGEDNGWDKQPPIQLNVRHPGECFEIRHEQEWPLARTQWTRFALSPSRRALVQGASSEPGQLAFEAMGKGVTFLTEPFEVETEITGPSAVKLFVSSSTTDADIFLVLHLFDPDGKEVTFRGALDPHVPIGQGWLRASHRKLDTDLSTFYRPYHTHDELWPLKPDEVVELDIEIWPTSIVAPAGYRIGLTVMGRDYEVDAAPGFLSNVGKPLRGCGPFLHDDPDNRPPHVFGGTTTLHFGKNMEAFIVLPVIPKGK